MIAGGNLGAVRMAVRHRVLILLVPCLWFSAAASQTEPNAFPPPHSDVPLYRQNLFARIFRDQPMLVTEWFPRQLTTPGLASGLFVTTLLAANCERRQKSEGKHREQDQGFEISHVVLHSL